MCSSGHCTELLPPDAYAVEANDSTISINDRAEVVLTGCYDSGNRSRVCIYRDGEYTRIETSRAERCFFGRHQCQWNSCIVGVRKHWWILEKFYIQQRGIH